MIRFYYHAGSDQTASLLTQRIQQNIEAGKEVLLIVPEQQTVSTERRMLELLPPSAQLQFEVVNFSRLANRVFRTLGGHSWNTATPTVRALSMWRALRDLAPLLLQYGTHAHEARLCDMMLETAKRCKAYHIAADDLLRTADALPEDEPLSRKLRDLGSVLGAFEATLGTAFDNGDDDLDRLADKLRIHGKALFANTYIYVDSFTDYTEQELSVLRALIAAAPEVSFTFPLASPTDTGLHLQSILHTHKRLQRVARELGEEIHMERVTPDAPKSAREYVARHLFDMNAEPAPLAMLEAPDISLTLCANPFSEAEAAVAEIHRLVRERGCRYRDITIVLRDANACVGILDAALEREGIPFFLSEKTDVTVRPLIKLILLALRLYLHAMRDEDVVGYLKTGLCGVSMDDVNLFEEYTSVWHPRGAAAYRTPFTRNPDGYAMKKTARAQAILAGANRVREQMIPPLFAFHEQLTAARNGTDACRALYDFLCALGVAEQLKEQAKERLAAGERREAEELSRLWTVTLGAIDDVARVLGDAALSVAEFAEALKMVFARTDIGTIPTSVDEVTIGSAVTLRADHPRFVLVLGLNEGVFPANVGDEGLINEQEKLRLAELGLELPSGRDERSSNELFFLYRAFNAPREGLYLSYTQTSSDGRAASPSIAVERVRHLMNEKPPRLFEAESALLHIYTPAAALERLSDLSRDERDAVCELLAEHDVPVARNLACKVSQKNADLTEQTAATLFDGKRMSPSHLESFAGCRFAYYCERVLKLREDKNATLELSDTGTFLHYVLEKAVEKEKNANGLPFAEKSDAYIEALVRESVDAYVADLCTTGGPLTPRAKALTERLTSLARLAVYSLYEEFSDSDFVPFFTELDLRKTGSSCRIALENGEQVTLSGKVDRADIWEAPNGKKYLRVVDYKTGTREFNPEDVKHGSSLQMPLYLMALTEKEHPGLLDGIANYHNVRTKIKEDWDKFCGIDPNDVRYTPDFPGNQKPIISDSVLTPAGVTYFSTAVKSENTPSRKDEQTAMQDAAKRLVRSGVLLDDPEVLAAASHKSDPDIVGKTKGKKHLSREEFDQMFADLSETVGRICTEMRRGVATAAPNPEKKNSPCNYCKYNAICRMGTVGEKGDQHGT